MTSTVSRVNYLRIAVSGAYICGILISPKLWFSFGRTFPKVPFVNGLPAFLSSNDYWLSILLLIALVLSLVSSRPTRYPVAVVVLTLLLVLFDQARLQPWVYQYVVMLALCACRRSNAADPTRAEPVLLAAQLLTALLYFWSGIQKLNWSFTHEVMPDLFTQAGVHLPATILLQIPVIGFVVALSEALIGVGLFIRRTRQAAVVLALSMHVLVLLMLIAARRNSVVWVWNIGMIVMVVLLFWRFDRSLVRRELWRWRGSDLASHLIKVVLVVCGLAPALSFFGWWDMYLSAALYSGNTAVGVVRISEQVRARLPVAAQQAIFATKRGELMLPFYEWSLADLNVPAYPEMRVYRQIARQLCVYAEDPVEVELIVKERPALLDGSYAVRRSDCADLLTR